MALTPAQRQAAKRERTQHSIDELTASNAALVKALEEERAVSASLRNELEAMKNRQQAAELSALKSQVKALKKSAQKSLPSSPATE